MQSVGLALAGALLLGFYVWLMRAAGYALKKGRSPFTVTRWPWRRCGK